MIDKLKQQYIKDKIQFIEISKEGKIKIKETGALNWGGSKMEEIIDDLIKE